MKLKPVEIAASALAAVAAAAVASVFGVKGTLIGAAIGSAVASSVAALVSQSLRRTRDVVRKAGVTVLARHGPSTSTVGDVEASERLSTPIADHEASPVQQPDTKAVGHPDAMENTTEKSVASEPDSAAPEEDARSRRRWKLALVGAGSALAAFLLALAIVTIVEVGAGRSLSSIFGGPKSGTTVGGFFSPPHSSPSTSVPASSTTTTSSTSTTVAPTTTAPAQGATTTTAPSTTTTAPGVTIP